MNNRPLSRPWFQFHLSTALLLMITAGVLMWLNLVGKTEPLPAEFAALLPRAHDLSMRVYGWPFPTYSQFIKDSDAPEELKVSADRNHVTYSSSTANFPDLYTTIDFSWIADALVALVILVLVAVLQIPPLVASPH